MPLMAKSLMENVQATNRFCVIFSDLGQPIFVPCQVSSPSTNTQVRFQFQHAAKRREIFEKSVQDGEGKVLSCTTHNELLPFTAYYEEILYFCDCLINNKEPLNDLPEHSVDSIKIVMAEIESADKDGERIAIK